MYSLQNSLFYACDTKNTDSEGNYEEITILANMAAGGGGKGQRHMQCDGTNVCTGGTRVLFNQINFADACDFNNVYVFAVPNKVLETSLDIRTNYLSVAQKNAINLSCGHSFILSYQNHFWR